MYRLGGVLVVDDEEEVCKLVTHALRRADIDAEYKVGALAARDRLKSNGISLAILDVRMPVEDGLSLSSWIKSHHPEIKIAMMSGDNVGYDPQFAFFDKPIDIKTLVDRVKTILSIDYLSKMRESDRARIDEIHNKVERWTVRHFISEFCADAIGRVLICLALSVVGYGISQAESMRGRVSELESTVRETAARTEMTSRETLSVLRQIGGHQR